MMVRESFGQGDVELLINTNSIYEISVLNPDLSLFPEDSRRDR